MSLGRIADVFIYTASVHATGAVKNTMPSLVQQWHMTSTAMTAANNNPTPQPSAEPYYTLRSQFAQTATDLITIAAPVVPLHQTWMINSTDTVRMTAENILHRYSNNFVPTNARTEKLPRRKKRKNVIAVDFGQKTNQTHTL